MAQGVRAAGRESLPEGAAEPKFSLPPVQRATLSNGMQLLLVEKHDLPVVNLHVVFPAGRAHDGQQTPGLAEMTAAVWDEGTAKRSAEEIASELGGMGASVSVSADWDTTSAAALLAEAAPAQGTGDLYRRSSRAEFPRAGTPSPADRRAWAA